MPFQTPITVKTALERIRFRQYVLPAIQREFVWSPEQICRLFDSLMRGYPIGSLLLWNITPATAAEFAFFEFVRHYHERTARHSQRLDIPASVPVSAVLDGQQRLTALNIGLRGSHAAKLPRKWRNSPGAFPLKQLYLDLAAAGEQDDVGLEYLFRFLTTEEALAAGPRWFCVPRILELDPGPDLYDYIQQSGLATDPRAFRTLYRLHQVVHTDLTVNYYEEEAQDIDRVLNIFIRVNSAGTVLSYSDLLLSIATAQWETTDAREAVYGLVDELNAFGKGFSFSKDLILKAGLVLSDVNDIGFKVSNFNASNMRKLEENWAGIARSLRVAVQLLADFGFSEINLRAHSVLIPLAYYVHRRGLSDQYLRAAAFARDRSEVRSWVIRSLIKAGVWGSGLDTLLTALRAVLRENTKDSFPAAELEAAMARLGKSLRFDADEIEDLAESRYGARALFPLLTLLYPGVNVRADWHEDHIFPRAQLTPARLRRAGIPDSDHWEFFDYLNGLPNLQLLEGSVNTQKSDMLPGDWLVFQFPEEQQRAHYMASCDMPELPPGLSGFPAFYRARRDRIAARLARLLGAEQPAALQHQ